MTEYTNIDLGTFAEIAKLENGKAFLHDALNLTSCEISVNIAPKGFKVPFNHKHKQNEEVYIVLKGSGIITVGDKKINVKEGSAVRVATGVARTIENTGDSELHFICVQAKEGSLTQFAFGDAELC
ncbi:MAG: cupin domain-containing protein [Alphaproteobacteria bacterium]|nr:cupin domain-containing protein [Alphaproteobacteria bacterium]MBR1600233.1 cupin domain-containing protein [Alphaproteobacteria bacterium]